MPRRSNWYRRFALAGVFSLLAVAFAVLAQAPATPPSDAPPPAAPPSSGKVKVGDEMKNTLGRVTDVDRGDNGCFVTFRDARNGEYIELGKFELCSQKPSFKGKQVELEYRMETVQAASCYGDPKCKKTETVPLIVRIKIIE